MCECFFFRCVSNHVIFKGKPSICAETAERFDPGCLLQTVKYGERSGMICEQCLYIRNPTTPIVFLHVSINTQISLRNLSNQIHPTFAARTLIIKEDNGPILADKCVGQCYEKYSSDDEHFIAPLQPPGQKRKGYFRKIRVRRRCTRTI